MHLVGYECCMWMPLDLIPAHNWLVNNLVPVLPGTGPENTQAPYSFCFLSSCVSQAPGGCLCKHSLAKTPISYVTASSCPCSSESLFIYFLEQKEGEEWGQARELELQTRKHLNTPYLETANSKNLPQILQPNPVFPLRLILLK